MFLFLTKKMKKKKKKNSKYKIDFKNNLKRTELKTFGWDILNPVLLINLEIKKKRGSSIDLDIHQPKVLAL